MIQELFTVVASIFMWYVVVGFAAFYLLWVFFLAVMSLKKAYESDTLSKPLIVLGFPILLVGFTIDFLVNVFFMTIVLVELPKEFTVSERLKRHRNESSGYRLTVAEAFVPILNTFDPDHI